MPLPTIPATTNGIATARVDLQFKLTPAQYEMGLIIDALPLLDMACRSVIASGGCRIALLLQGASILEYVASIVARSLTSGSTAG
jgi:hypothetical protein